MGIVGGIYDRAIGMVAVGGDAAEMQDNKGRKREAEILVRQRDDGREHSRKEIDGGTLGDKQGF